ncbi:MAG: iron ABC transporter permease [Propioniciclava sp.]|uniref:FecCD family ABC transporter permease n=1 Tax=Propioniciclava sp. TaxID=2038686 RepID=UPI0039E62A37
MTSPAKSGGSRALASGYLVVVVVLVAVVIGSVLLAVTFGSNRLAVGDVYGVIMHRLFGWGDAAWGSGPVHDVVWLIRLPRLVLAIAVGMALSVGGLTMQAVVRNPLADPYIMGISAGAYAGAALAILGEVGGAAFGAQATGIMAFIGAGVASLAVVGLANVGGRATSVRLILAGTALGAVFAAFSNFMVFRTNQSSRVQEIVNWTMGSLGRASWPLNGPVLAVMLVCVGVLWLQYRNLNLMLMGDQVAITLGTRLHHRRIAFLLIGALMVGLSVYAAGMIGFVGLVIPHIARMIFGTDHKKLVPISALFGAIFLIWADVLCRVAIAGTELPIGIFTSMVGAPVFVYLMARKKYGFGTPE